MGSETSRLTWRAMSRATLALVLTALLAGCAGTSLKEDYVRDAPSYSLAPAETGIRSASANRR